MITDKKKTIARLNYLHEAPRKVRLVANSLKGKNVIEAESILIYLPNRAAKPLLKLLRSATANAINNFKLDKNKLYISLITVDEGPMLKRWLPRAMGRATPIHKKTSHIKIELEERGEFKRYKAPQAKLTRSEKSLSKEKENKKEIKKSEEKETKDKETKKRYYSKVGESQKKSQEGVNKKFFRRKEIA